MSGRLVARQLALLLLLLSAGFLGLAAFAWGQWWLGAGPSESAAIKAFLISAATGGVLGSVTLLATIGIRERAEDLRRREALLLVGLTWIVGGALAALPYRLWAAFDSSLAADQPFHRFMDCYFESISGLTTTGATVLSAIGELPPSMLLWRSLTHWLGGLGIIVLFVAVLPSLRTGGKRLFRVEAAGPRHEGVKPQIGSTSKILWYLYAGLTAGCFLGYMAAGMTWFDAACHAFSTLSTGGLSTRDASIGYYDSVWVDVVAIVFMLLAGVNFALFHDLIEGRFKAVRTDVELRVYLLSKLAVLALILPPLITTTMNLTNGDTDGPGVGPALRHGTFAVVSMHTGTGFGTADFETWPAFVNMLLIGLMFVGGCAGSTAGGIKVVRFWMAVRIMAAELEKAFRPAVVRPLRIGGAVIDPALKLAVLAYLLGYFAVFVVGAMAVQLLEGDTTDLLTSTTASLATLSNVGPGLGAVGPTENYGGFGGGSKLVLSLLMVLGRLEFFAVVVLFTPRFWRAD